MPPYPMMFQGGPPDETQTGDPVSEQEALVRRLLSSLEPNQTPPPPQLSNSRRILGPLGDALMAMASVRAGGAPPQMGAFAAEQEKRRAAYEQRLTENARADRALRNSVRVGVMQGMVRRRNQIRMINTKDEAGNPITVPMEYDPSDSSLKPLETTTGQGSFGRYVTPGLSPYVDPATGQARIGLVDKTKGTIKPTLANGQPALVVPPEGAAKEATTGLGLGEALTRAEGSFGNYVRKRSEIGRIGTSAALKLPFGLGATLDEFVISRTDPEGSNTARDLSNVADMLLRLRSGAQINESEYLRLRALLPRLGENSDTAQQRFASFRAELSQRLSTNMRLHPDLFGEAALKNAGFTRDDILSIAAGVGQPTGSDAHDLFREMFGREPGNQ